MGLLARYGVFIVGCWALVLYGWGAVLMIAGVVLLTTIWEREDAISR